MPIPTTLSRPLPTNARRAPATRAPLRAAAITVLSALAALAASGASGQDELGWARTALERNGTLEFVSSDPAAGTLTVRVKSTGELRTVRADQLIAALPSGGQKIRTAEAAAGAPPGQVLASGPGYRITAANSAGGTPGATQAELAARDLPVEHRHDPIICQGDRQMRIDGKNLEFDFDAVDASAGCEVLITNSRIAARGVGVAIHSASVHIDNSVIEGDTRAVDASGDAQIYAQSSSFKGLIRRLDSAAFHDLGGNVGD
ncbi:MAG TPA: hypothetical protein VMG11_05880 [Steroidobacteraceae bacterium]|nr:hypothetical protein [Steroidobacteraceae bacterium]